MAVMDVSKKVTGGTNFFWVVNLDLHLEISGLVKTRKLADNKNKIT
jgi:hypothetical protein